MTNFAWAAGLLEGEGCFSKHVRKSNGRVCYAVHCEMADEDVIQKLYHVFNVGTIVLRKNTSGRKDRRVRKPTWIWSVQNKQGILYVLTNIVNYMGSRRKEKINLIIGELIESK